MLVIEDHAIYRAGLISVIECIEGVFITEACAVEKALALNITPDLILLDIQLDGMSGLKGVKKLHQQWPEVKVIIISANDSYFNTKLALEYGAIAFLSKSETTATILSVVSNVLNNINNDYIVSPMIANRIAGAPKLSARQIDVLQLMAKGNSNKTIAQILNISENTARWHVCTMNSIFQVSSRAETVFKARELGILS